MAGVAGQLVALREGRSFDIALVGWRGQPERVARDSWLLGTGLSAPVVMLAVQAAATVRLGAGPSLTATRTLGFARRGDGVRIPCRAGIPQRRPVPRRLDSDKDAHRGGRICIRRRDGRVRPAGPRQHLTLEVSRPTNHHHHAGQFSTVDKGSRSRRRRPFPHRLLGHLRRTRGVSDAPPPARTDNTFMVFSSTGSADGLAGPVTLLRRSDP